MFQSIFNSFTASGLLTPPALSSPGAALSEWSSVLLSGLLTTIELAVGGYALGLFIGIWGASGKLYGGSITRDLLGLYTTLVRALPDLILMLLLYYAGADAVNRILALVGMPPIEINQFVAGIMVIGIVQGAYSTEVLRGAIKSISPGQIEAAKAYGMGPFMIFRRITFPAMLPFALPGLANLWMIATKDTALLAVIGFRELTLATRQAAGATKYYMLFYCAAGVLYLLLSFVSNVGIRTLEKRMRRGLTRTT